MKNDFTVVWSCRKQCYTVYKNGKYLLRAFKYDDAKSYSEGVIYG